MLKILTLTIISFLRNFFKVFFLTLIYLCWSPLLVDVLISLSKFLIRGWIPSSFSLFHYYENIFNLDFTCKVTESIVKTCHFSLSCRSTEQKIVLVIGSTPSSSIFVFSKLESVCHIPLNFCYYPRKKQFTSI